MNINLQIVQAAISLTEERGMRIEVKNLGGFVQNFDFEDLSIIYTTPFSGAEIYPGEKAYMVDIWHQRKKLYSVYFKNVDELTDCKKRPKGEWVNKLLTL